MGLGGGSDRPRGGADPAGADRDPARPALSADAQFHADLVGLRDAGRVRQRRLASQAPSYLDERFPTEVRATAGGFCYHQGAIWGGLVAPIMAYFATAWQLATRSR